MTWLYIIDKKNENEWLLLNFYGTQPICSQWMRFKIYTYTYLYIYIKWSIEIKFWKSKEREKEREGGGREEESWGYVAWKWEDHKKLIMCSFMDYYFSRSTNTTQQNKEKIALLHPHLSFITWYARQWLYRHNGRNI